jgi:hypothetical protein
VNADGLSQGERAALATAYLALMTDHVLDMTGAEGSIVVEGPLATRNPLYGAILAVLRASGHVRCSADETGTVAGACILAGGRPRASLAAPHMPLDAMRLRAYRERWRAQVAAAASGS